MSSLPIGRFAGILVRIHVSWVIILTLLMVTAATQVGEMDPASSATIRWAIALTVSVAFVLSATIHELAHALVARQRGVPVDEVVVYFLGSAATTEIVGTRPRDEIAIAAAGPVASIVLGAVLVVASQVALVVGADGIARILVVIGLLDLLLGGINLLPAYPLDGGRIVRGIGWARSGDANRGLRLAATSGRTVGLLLAVGSVLAIVFLQVVDGLMIALCGWFLISTSRQVERGAGLDRLIDGLLVGDVMERDVATLAPSLTIDTFAGQMLDGTAAMALPVTRGDVLLGVIGARQVRGLRRDRWTTTRAEDLMVATDRLPVVAPETTVRSVLDGFRRTRLDGLPVLVEGALTGVVTRRGVSDAVKDRAARSGTPLT